SWVEKTTWLSFLAFFLITGSLRGLRQQWDVAFRQALVEKAHDEATRTAKRMEQRVLTEHAINRILATSLTSDEAIGRILEAVGETLSWHAGAFWRLDE